MAAFVLFYGTSSPASAADVAPAVSDESRLIRLETKVDAINDRLDGIEKHMDQRMDHLEQRVDRLEQSLDRRFQELRTDMNSQFDRLNNLFIGICSIFGLLVVALFGFVLWDRRSMLRPLDAYMRRLEDDLATKGSKSVLDATVNALRAWAQENQQLAAVLKRFNLM